MLVKWPCNCCFSSMLIEECVAERLGNTDSPGLKLHNLIDLYNHPMYDEFFVELLDASLAHWIRYYKIIEDIK